MQETIQIPKYADNPYIDCQGIQAKRSRLASLTARAKEVQEQIMIATGKMVRVNQLLIEFYKNDTRTEFKTFKQWQKEGKKVIKGSKAWVVWSRPLSIEVNEEGKKETVQDDKGTYFSLSFLFDNTQVA